MSYNIEYLNTNAPQVFLPPQRVLTKSKGYLQMATSDCINTSDQTQFQNEEWRDIPNYEGYYTVSNLGRVKALKSFNNRWIAGRLLTPQPRRYMHMIVRLCKNGKHRMHFVHRLVLAAFVGEPPSNQPEVNHKNGNPQDNRLLNLEYCSRAENEWHKRNVLMNNNEGEKHGQSKLTETDVIEIRKLSAQGVTQNDIAKRFGISHGNVSIIVLRKGWKHV